MPLPANKHFRPFLAFKRFSLLFSFIKFFVFFILAALGLCFYVLSYICFFLVQKQSEKNYGKCMDKYIYTRSEWVSRKDVKMEIFEIILKVLARRRWCWRVAAAARSKLMEAMMKRNLQREYSIFPFPFWIQCSMFYVLYFKQHIITSPCFFLCLFLSLLPHSHQVSSSTCSFAYSTTQPTNHPSIHPPKQ